MSLDLCWGPPRRTRLCPRTCLVRVCQIEYAQCLRIFALTILFSSGFSSAFSALAATASYHPWKSCCGDLPGPDPVVELRGLTGEAFVSTFISCLGTF